MQPNGMESLYQKEHVCGGSVGWELSDPVVVGCEYVISEKGCDNFTEGTLIGGTLTEGLPTALLVDDELSTMFFSPISDPDCRDSTLIDMKFGGMENHRCSKSFKSSQRTLVGSSAESHAPVKRSRSAGLTFFCQVLGCNKDLSSSKDYHKRHRVCDSHSKTARVIVNGIEQRFCQQCSRFHLLGEFDEGKRSCRRRLAGHNERRRKPHLGNHCGRNHRSHSYKANSWNQHIKAEFEDECTEFFAAPPANGNLLPRDNSLTVSFGKPYPCRDDSLTFMTSGSSIFCAEPNHNGFSTTASPSAPSLLSSQSRDSPSYSTGIPMAQTWSIKNNPSHCSTNLVSDTPSRAFPVSSVNGVSHKLAACELNLETSDLHTIQIPEYNFDVKIEGSEFFEGLIFDTDGVSCQDGFTIDLTQLSTNLQRVERQNQSTHVMSHPHPHM